MTTSRNKLINHRMGYIIIYQIFKQTHVFHQYVIGSIFQTQKSVSDIQQNGSKMSQILCRYILPWSSRDQTKISTRNAKTIEYRSTEPRQNKCPPKFCSWHVLASWGLEHVYMASDNGKPNSSKMQNKTMPPLVFSNMFQHITYESWNYQSDLTHNFGPRAEGLFSTVAQIRQQLEPDIGCPWIDSTLTGVSVCFMEPILGW